MQTIRIQENAGSRQQEVPVYISVEWIHIVTLKTVAQYGPSACKILICLYAHTHTKKSGYLAHNNVTLHREQFADNSRILDLQYRGCAARS